MRLVMTRDHRAFGRAVRAGEEIDVNEVEARTWVKAGWARKADEPHELEQERRGPGRPRKQLTQEATPRYDRRDMRAEED